LIFVVTIVATLTRLDNSITATGRLAISAGICGILITVVTALPRAQNTIATTGKTTMI
jgi:hypothetical protein